MGRVLFPHFLASLNPNPVGGEDLREGKKENLDKARVFSQSVGPRNNSAGGLRHDLRESGPMVYTCVKCPAQSEGPSSVGVVFRKSVVQVEQERNKEQCQAVRQKASSIFFQAEVIS